MPFILKCIQYVVTSIYKTSDTYSCMKFAHSCVVNE